MLRIINLVVFKSCTIMVLRIKLKASRKQQTNWSREECRFFFQRNIQLNWNRFKFIAVDLDGIYTILSWLSYIPSKVGNGLPIVIPNDPVERPVGFVPTKAPYDPRWMIAGRPNPTNPGEWESGLFDRNSWSEIMERYGCCFFFYCVMHSFSICSTDAI